MANGEHVALLKQGVDAWNAWRFKNPNSRPDLSETDLSGMNLSGANLAEAKLVVANLSGADLKRARLIDANLNSANLRRANLSGANLLAANLIEANLIEADLRRADLNFAELYKAYLDGADLSEANLSWANPIEANFRRTNLSGADLRGANLREANFVDAILSGANLEAATLLDTDLTGADLTGCRVHGVSTWRLKLDTRTKQKNLVITRQDEPAITIDNIEVAQFIYLLLNNEKVRDVIDTVTSKTVLILGRFTAERKSVLDAIREELRRRGYLPILFDFDKPANRDVTETISLLARIARFVVADITDAKAIPQELNVIVPDLPSVPVQPLLLKDGGEYGMFEHYARYPWVLPLYQYETQDQLITALGEQVIEPAERKALELASGARPIPPII
ncbi:uncharacterized protein YjbI with pentapeptide repeats [Bradyrhizobium sp. USDA 4516]